MHAPLQLILLIYCSSADAIIMHCETQEKLIHKSLKHKSHFLFLLFINVSIDNNKMDHTLTITDITLVHNTATGTKVHRFTDTTSQSRRIYRVHFQKKKKSTKQTVKV